MAKIKMVTRTVVVHTFSVMCVDTVTAEVTSREFKLGSSYDKKKNPIDFLKSEYETDTVKLVAVQDETVETVLYGMPETEFIANASILPPRTASAEEA